MRQRYEEKITNIPNDFNTFQSTFDVRVFSDDLHDFVVITETERNPGPSITNCAETACPFIAVKLRLDWRRCVFVEHYPPAPAQCLNECDPTFDHIQFAGKPESKWVYFLGKEILHAKLADRGWRPLSLSMAQSLQNVGCVMSSLIGKKVKFRGKGNQHDQWAIIEAYDGRQYHTQSGIFLAQDILQF